MELLRVAAVVVGDGELDGLDAPEVVLVGNVQAARLRGRLLARHVRDGADGVRHEVDRHDVIATAGVFGQLAREVAVDERVEHEHAPIAGVALVHGAVLVDEHVLEERVDGRAQRREGGEGGTEMIDSESLLHASSSLVGGGQKRALGVG